MLAALPFRASSNTALWRAISKPPVELVVAYLGKEMLDNIYRWGGTHKQDALVSTVAGSVYRGEAHV